MYLLWKIHSGPHSITCGLPHVDPGTPISASNFQVHCRLERTPGPRLTAETLVCLGHNITPSTGPVHALHQLLHLFPLHLTVTTCPSLMSPPFGSSMISSLMINTWLGDTTRPVSPPCPCPRFSPGITRPEAACMC